MSSAGPLVPLQLARQGEDGLTIIWSDGHRAVYTWKHLRAACPCATCRDEREKPPDPFRILGPADLTPSAPIAPLAVEPIGRYAYRFAWNDGHGAGLYTLEHLRALCQCPDCLARPDPRPN
jgi:DUF971 family protein